MEAGSVFNILFNRPANKRNFPAVVYSNSYRLLDPVDIGAHGGDDKFSFSSPDFPFKTIG